MVTTVGLLLVAALVIFAAAIYVAKNFGSGSKNAIVAAGGYSIALVALANLVTRRQIPLSIIMLALALLGAIYCTRIALKARPLDRYWFVIPILMIALGAAVAGTQLFLDRDSGRAQSDAASTTGPAGTKADFNEIPGQFPPQESDVPGGSVAPVGACVSLDGQSHNAKLKVVDCGSPSNGYKVIQRVSTPAECPADVDHKFYMYPDEGEFTACLDYAWSANDCLSIGKVTAIRTACDDASKPKREKPLKVILNTTTNAGCGPTGGFPHPVRKFTVCTETQR